MIINQYWPWIRAIVFDKHGNIRSLAQKEINNQWQKDRVFTPQISDDETENLKEAWNRALKVAMHWSEK